MGGLNILSCVLTKTKHAYYKASNISGGFPVQGGLFDSDVFVVAGPRRKTAEQAPQALPRAPSRQTTGPSSGGVLVHTPRGINNSVPLHGREITIRKIYINLK
ncbi:unnamed protein product [Danaus chrysippus]|uniref:(African queen) hypothetical protein n=1 Tax=Danaus chrysippus TaxID=151541 RepID=A0A8J2QQP5_9NEOP|nr:unnamed protein product [Danaus chrysippus]